MVEQKSDEEFSQLFYRSHNEREFAYSLGILNLGGGTYFSLKKRCERLGLDGRKQWAGAKRVSSLPVHQNDETYFAENTAHTGADTRTRIRREGLLPYRCSICGNSGRWNEQELTLEIDHINGDHFDNRLANLRFLCPNCHSQTQTYGGKNARTRPLRKEPPKNVSFVFANAPGSPREEKFLFCRRCGKPITRWSKRGLCPECAAFFARKVKRPDPAKVLIDVSRHGLTWSGQKYGVSVSTIRKWLDEAKLPYRKQEIHAYFLTGQPEGIS